MEIIITIKNDEGELSNSKRYKDGVTTEPTSPYVQFFDDNNPNWSNGDREYNLMFLKCQERYFNDMLKTKGFVFLNDVLEQLGFKKSKSGQIVGWVCNENNPIGDNYIDFDLDNDRNAKYLNGTSNVIVLDFNVDGCILDQL